MNNDNIIGFDPIAWANQNESGNEAKKPQVNNNSQVDFSAKDSQTVTEEVRDLVELLVSRGINIAEDYGDWLKVGFAFASEFGESGRALFHKVSSMSSKYDSAKNDKQYDNCLRSRGQGVNIESLFWMAQKAGVDLSEFAREHQSPLIFSAISAITPSANEMEKEVNNGVLGNDDNGMAHGALAQVAQKTSLAASGYSFSDKLNPDDLPAFVRTIFDKHHDTPSKCDAMILGALNVVSGVMGMANGTEDSPSGIYGIYDGRRVYAPSFTIVFSGAGNDKGSLIFCKHLVHQIKSEIRAQYDRAKRQYDEELLQYEAKSKKDRGTAPEPPVYRDPFVPGNSSSSAVYRAMDANGGCGLMFETEADTVSAMLDSDYGNYSELMRKAFHHEALSMNRVQDNLHIDIDNPRLSVLLTCTPGQLKSLFPSFENGLGSRFLFYNLPDEEVVFHDVFAMTDTPLEDTYKKLGEQMLPLYHAMQRRTGHPIQFVMSDAQQREFLATYSDILQQQFSMLGKGMRAFVFRIALMCFRYCMILSTLRRLSDWNEHFDASNPDQGPIFSDDENALVCDDRDFRVAMTIIEALVNHTSRVYAVLAKENDNPFANKGIRLKADELHVYKDIPEGEFATQEFLRIAEGHNIPRRTAQRMLSDFSNLYQIVIPLRRGQYLKVVVKEE